MKIWKVFMLLLLLCIFNRTFSMYFILKVSQNDKNLANYVCKITKDLQKSKTDTQDVLIGNLDDKSWTSTVNDIAGCIISDSAVVVSDFKKVLDEKSLKKAAIIVLALASADQNLMHGLIGKQLQSKVWNHKATVFIIVKSTISSTQRLEILQILMMSGFFDCSIIHENKNGKIVFELFQTLKPNLNVLTNPEVSELEFSKKWKDMTGFTYQIIAFDQRPRVKVNSNGIFSALMYFIKAVAKYQNAGYEVNIIKNLKEFAPKWRNRSFHLSLSVGVQMNTDEPMLITYEENGYCALIPLPPKVPLFQSIFIEPFDGLTWLFLVVTMACCVAVWWMFHDRGAVDSPWMLAYGMVVMFIGQGVEFSRKNRVVLGILLQLIIVMIWVLSQAYVGVITSFMIQPIQEHRLETFDDLVSSDFEILSDDNFIFSILGSEASKTLNLRLKSSPKETKFDFLAELGRQHYVFIVNCDQAEMIVGLELLIGKKPIGELYYKLPENILPHLIKLEASYLNPVLDKLQFFMDLAFQSGLLQIWELYQSMEFQFKKKANYIEEFDYLKLQDLTQVFSIVVIGNLLSTALFILEVFYCDILRKILLANLTQKLRNRIHKMAYKKRKQPKHPKYQKGALYYIMHRRKRVKRLKARKLKVRRIFVQPRFPMD